MKKDGFWAEVLTAVVNDWRKKVRKNPPNLFLNQKKQLWYSLMNAVDAEDEAAAQTAAEEKPNA